MSLHEERCLGGGWGPCTCIYRELNTTGARAVSLPTPDHIDRLSVWAVRYALGRRTYAVADVVDVLSRNVACLSANSKAVIVRDITEAEKRGGLGMECDSVEWRRLREVLSR